MCNIFLSSTRDYFVNEIDQTCTHSPKLLGYKKISFSFEIPCSVLKVNYNSTNFEKSIMCFNSSLFTGQLTLQYQRLN